jgi:2-polyprenyl-3-methyl-5-hydroxy-6-metoxy-1,4-benzoquinol methylase
MKFTENMMELNHCLACGSENLKLTLNLNNQPLANSYKNTKAEKQTEFPLAINRCTDCYHVQLTHAVDPELMFKDYLYVSGTTKTMKDHFRWFADYSYEYFSMMNMFKPMNILDIGCNDGTQLDSFKEKGAYTYGVDPAQNLYPLSSKNHTVYPTFFDMNFVVSNRSETYRHFDIVVAQNVFAHNYNPRAFLNAARNIMIDSSLLFIQTSQADMIRNNEFDTIYHEHISFYNINSMKELCKMAAMYLVDVIKCPLHGNSYIFVISKNKNVARKANIENHIAMERKAGLLSEQTYIDYAKNCETITNKLRNTIFACRSVDNKTKIVGYGAAAKGMTLLNYAKIDLDWIVDDNPLKQGKFTPGQSIPILSVDSIKNDDSIVFVPLAWNFFDEIKSKIKSIRNKNNDTFITYFPKVEISK